MCSGTGGWLASPSGLFKGHVLSGIFEQGSYPFSSPSTLTHVLRVSLISLFAFDFASELGSRTNEQKFGTVPGKLLLLESVRSMAKGTQEPE